MPLEGCRSTGTAINIIDPSSVALDEINWYSQTSRIEGNPQLTSYVKALFAEGQNDFHSQLFLHNAEIWASYKKGFHYFDNAPMPNATEYQEWKASHIFKCGSVWSPEVNDLSYILFRNLRKNSDLNLQNLIIQTSIAYGEHMGDLTKKRPLNANFDFDLGRVHSVETLLYKNSSAPQDQSHLNAWLKIL